MSQRDGFASGFFVGAIFGSVVGGVMGSLIASRRDAQITEEEQQMANKPIEAKASMRRRMRHTGPQGTEIETARRSLEDKIAQLNATIDEVREQLGSVKGSSNEQKPTSSSEEAR